MDELKTYTLNLKSAPVMPIGFETLGTITADGIDFGQTKTYDVAAWGGKKAHTFDVSFESVNPEIIYHLFGAELAEIKPLPWYRRWWNTIMKKVKR